MSTMAAVILVAALSAPADTGVGIQAGNVCLSTPAQPGGSYQPGTVYVANKGSGTEAISLSAGPMSSGHARPVPPAWVTFSYPALLWIIPQHSVSIAPGQGASVPVTLNIPASAVRGQYEARLTAYAGGTPASGGGVQAELGAAAITFLKFGVGTAPAGCSPPSPSQASPAPGPAGAPGWSLLAVAGIIALAVAGLARRWLRRRTSPRTRWTS